LISINGDGRALQHRFGDLTAVWVPDPIHEAMLDFVRTPWTP
jgi:hypothetical protein